MSLSPTARAWAIERVLAGVENRWFERQIRLAPTEEAAVRWCRSNNWSRGGSRPDGRRFQCTYDRVDVEYPDGSSGRLSWLEVVRAARAHYGQAVLL